MSDNIVSSSSSAPVEVAPTTVEASDAPIAVVGNKKARKLEKNPEAGLGTQRPAVSRRAAESESGPTRDFCGLSQRDERRLYTTFASRKALWLAEIEKHSAPITTRDDADKSNKGFIDTRCLPIIELLNAHPDYVTTSSCSGRICLFHTVGALGAADPEREGEAEVATDDNNGDASSAATMKRGADGSLGWILASHESPLSEEQIQLVLRHTVPGHSGSANADSNAEAEEGAAAGPSPVADVNGCMVAGGIPQKGQVSLKCEPFLLHVQCRTIEAAKRLLNAASEAGFRNSGMIPPGKNIMVGIRHASLSVDAPIVADGGISFASEAFVRYLVKVAEEKMAENFRRTVMLEKAIARWIRTPTAASAESDGKKAKMADE